MKGNFLPKYAQPTAPLNDAGLYEPFEDRLAFDWAHYHFVELQSSERKIHKGLDLWMATKLKCGDESPLPWASASQMYGTIDEIQAGDAPFSTVKFRYNGVLPENPPNWMTTDYELCTRNSRKLLQNQISTTDFADNFDYRPYRQFDHSGDRVWSNLFSGDWVWNEAVSFVFIL